MNKQISNFVDEILFNLQELEEWLHNNQTIAVCDAIYKQKLYYEEMLAKVLEWETIH